MLIKNAIVLGEDFSFFKGNVKIKGELISEIGGVSDDDDFIDAEGLYLIPGFIDIHMHGCKGLDFSNADECGLGSMSAYQAENGVTSFLPASLALSENQLEKAFAMLGAYMKKPQAGSHIFGAYMEGPFLSKEKKGAQPEEFLRLPDVELFRRLNAAACGCIKMVALAPELEGSPDFISEVKDTVNISIAHTTADYETTKRAIDAGAVNVTHLYNAMPPLNHKNPGVIGAAFDSVVTVELICDGIHIHPAVIRATYKEVGANRVILVSDSMPACGMPDGCYDFGGHKVYVANGAARLSDGTIAGSAKNLYQCVKTALSFGIPLQDAVKSASINPAKAIGVDHLTGSISCGKYADLLLTDRELGLKTVFARGKKITGVLP